MVGADADLAVLAMPNDVPNRASDSRSSASGTCSRRRGATIEKLAAVFENRELELIGAAVDFAQVLAEIGSDTGMATIPNRCAVGDPERGSKLR